MTPMIANPRVPSRAFALVLAGGGARGFAHAGVLRALEQLGAVPSAAIGVSMGALVAATYALREDWYQALLGVARSSFPQPLHARAGGRRTASERIRAPFRLARGVWELFFGWGVGTSALAPARKMLDELTQGRPLESGRIPVAVCATDLVSGRRVVFRSGSASDALHASAALAGIAPPLRRRDQLLADGVYADIAPVDVARDLGCPVVIAVDPGQALVTGEIHNGFGAMLRAIEICQMQHASLRFAQADLVLRPQFARTIDTLEFGARRECVAAGIRVVREQQRAIGQLLALGAAPKGTMNSAPGRIQRAR